MGSATPGLVAAFILTTLFATGFVTLAYNLQWPMALVAGTVAGEVMVFLLRNREKNVKKWREHPTTFPNPLGGGLIGEYIKRPWMEELAELGRLYNRKRARKRRAAKKREDTKEEE